jgi:glycosyltransferase involved in cell wall biosynthesis
MRIAFDIAAIRRGGGGAERQVLEVASGLQDRGHEVLLVVNKAAEHYSEYVDSLRVWELHRTSRWDLRVVRDIRRAFRRFEPDVCVCVAYNASLWGRLAAARLGPAIVVAEHTTRVQTPFEIAMTNKLLRGVTDRVIACAEAQVDSLVRGGHERKKIRVVPNGVDVRRFARDDEGGRRARHELDIPTDAPIVMLVAVHRPEKRHDRFVSLVEALHDRGVQAWGVMVGDGPLFHRSLQLAQASRVAPFLRVAGSRSDMSAMYSAADVVVLVTDLETFPLCFLEAAACEVPVVGLDVGGVSETLVDGQTGYVVDRGDDAGMASRVAGLLVDPGRRQRMGKAGRAFVEHHLSRDAMIDGYERVLGEARDNRRRRP